MKKYILLISILFLSISCGKKSSETNYNISTNQISSNLNQKSDGLSNSSEEKDNDKIIHDVYGRIISKYTIGKKGCGCDRKYYFSIKLSNGDVFDWETIKSKWDLKNKNDGVYFDYLRKDRFSNKSIE